jgi:DNA-binding SARP family transcriptional activator
VFNRCSNKLSTELGVEPSPETQKIYQELLAGA